MEWSGDQTGNGFQLVDFRVEKVTALPTFSPSFEGRLIYVTQGLDQGWYGATDTAWVPLDNTGGGATTLGALTDVTLTSPTNGQSLNFNSGSNVWENQTPTGGGGGAFDFAFEQVAITSTDTLANLPSTPSDVNAVKLFINGLLQRINIDYSVLGQVITWKPLPVDPNTITIETTDLAQVFYPVNISSGGVILEVLSITGPNTITSISNQPSNPAAVMLYINGQLRVIQVDYLMTGGTNQDFSWFSPTLNIDTNDRAIAFYTI